MGDGGGGAEWGWEEEGMMGLREVLGVWMGGRGVGETIVNESWAGLNEFGGDEELLKQGGSATHGVRW